MSKNEPRGIREEIEDLAETAAVYGADHQRTVSKVKHVTGLVDSYIKEAVREADVNETKLIEERDKLEENLDSLTQAAALYFKTDFGEHSSANNPWFNAFKKLRDDTITNEETGGE